jgi:hypothetical protein
VLLPGYMGSWVGFGGLGVYRLASCDAIVHVAMGFVRTLGGNVVCLAFKMREQHFQENTSKLEKEHARRKEKKKKPNPSEGMVKSVIRSKERRRQRRDLCAREREREREKKGVVIHRYKTYSPKAQVQVQVQAHSKPEKKKLLKKKKKKHLQQQIPRHPNKKKKPSTHAFAISKSPLSKNYHLSSKNPQNPQKKFQNSTISPNLTSFLPSSALLNLSDPSTPLLKLPNPLPSPSNAPFSSSPRHPPTPNPHLSS